MFLEEKSSLNDGSRVEPVLSKGGTAHDAFVKEYLGKTDSSLQTYYRTLVFTGKGSMPKAQSSDNDVVAYVARTRGAIGYVGTGTSTDGVKTPPDRLGAGPEEPTTGEGAATATTDTVAAAMETHATAQTNHRARWRQRRKCTPKSPPRRRDRTVIRPCREPPTGAPTIQ